MSANDSFEFVPLELDESNVEETLHALIERAADLPASDFYLASEEETIEVSVRHLGIIRHLQSFPADLGRRMISHLKAMAGLDIAERRRPADGRWIFHRHDGRKLDLRVNVIPTLYGEDAGIRLLDREMGLLQLDQLGLTRQDYNLLLAMLSNPSGLILVTGPTSSGKTTTLYSALCHLNDGRRKLNTLEDPIEYAVAGLRQSQIHPKLGVDFPELLSHVLRQSPDVVMIGEIRDPTTAKIAVRAANSGLLVLATLHAPVAASAIVSMRAMEVSPQFLASSLQGVVSQRLVRVLCTQCRKPIDLSDAPHTFEEVSDHLQPGEGQQMFSPGGCQLCHGTGYSSRTGLFEVLNVTPEIRKLIANRSKTSDLHRQAMNQGMTPFRHGALLRVAKGETSTEEIFRAVPTEVIVEEL